MKNKQTASNDKASNDYNFKKFIKSRDCYKSGEKFVKFDKQNTYISSLARHELGLKTNRISLMVDKAKGAILIVAGDDYKVTFSSKTSGGYFSGRSVMKSLNIKAGKYKATRYGNGILVFVETNS